MDSQQQILNLAKKRENLQDQVNKKKSLIANIQDKIGGYEEQIQQIDKQIATIKYRDAQQDAQLAKEKEKNSDNPMEVEEEADAAITTGALDASSQSVGGDYGGWRHYSKIGDTSTRKTPKVKKAKKKKNIYKFMEHVWDETIDNGE